jgi:large subunit ribosomal protein L23
MSNARDVIIRPIVTEKSMKDYDNLNIVTFQVAKGVNRTQVRQAVEEIFSVKVKRVNMINVAPKKRRVGKYSGKTSAVYKALVKLAEGYEIKLFDNV